MDLRAECSEAVGIFLLVTCGGLAGLAGAGLATALVVGATLMVLVYSLGHVSGAHFNPAITLALASTRHFPWRRVPSYVAAQVLGALAAFLVLGWLVPTSGAVSAPTLDALRIGLLEVLGTGLLAFVIVSVATDKRVHAGTQGLAIGATLAICVAATIPWSGGTVNPAVALGRALVQGQVSMLLIYVVTPLLGAVLGMAAYEGLRKEKAAEPRQPLGATGPFKLEHQP